MAGPFLLSSTLFCEALTEEILEQKQLREEVYAALMQLPAIQARRIYARFYLGMSVCLRLPDRGR